MVKIGSNMAQLKISPRKIYWLAGFAVLIFVALFFWGNTEEIIRNFRSFHFIFLPFILLLSLVNYFLRFLKWQLYLKELKIKLKRGFSLRVFFSGLAFSITPAKLGEVFKSYILKNTHQISIAKTAPIVLVDRLTDLIGILILVCLGVFVFKYGVWIFIVSILFLLFFIFLLISPSANQWLINHFLKIKFFQRFARHLKTAFLTSHILLKFKPLFLAIVLSVFAWGAEALGFYLVFLGMNIFSISLLAAFFIYSFSTLLGAISMIPGGIGLQEACMAGLLVLMNLTKDQSATATLLIRVCTLWFAVILGILVLFVSGKKFSHNIKTK